MPVVPLFRITFQINRMQTITTEAPFVFHQGSKPLLVSIPHVGTYVPPAIAARMTAEAQQVHDTDWHLDQLYAFATDMGASILQATHSRYVVDLNRPPDNANLYPGQDTTGLCPVDTFDANPIYLPGEAPEDAEIATRRAAVWQPYHQQLAQELARIRALHGAVVLWDAHSIRSVVPRFFEGTLPDLNLGTANGASCAPALAQALLATAAKAPGYTTVLNGRFKGGHITRHYGQPQLGVHAVQLEMTQSSYMQEQMPFDYLPALAARVQPHLQALLTVALQFAQHNAA
jgi:N-formylglutamate deformylase